MDPIVTTDQVDNRPVDQERVPPLNPTRLKVAGVVLGLLLAGLALAFHFHHINAIAVYSTGVGGGALIAAMVIWSLIDCTRKSKQHAKDISNQECQEKWGWLAKAREGKTEEIRKALDEGLSTPDLNLMLRCAAENGRVDTIKLLIERGADPTKEKTDGYTALHLAILSKNGLDAGFEAAQVLLDSFPDLVNMEGSPLSGYQRVSPLHLACLGSIESPHSERVHTDAELIQLLLDRRADIHRVDEEKNTALHVAAQGTSLGLGPPDINVIKVLVRAGVSLEAKNKDGQTAFQIAQEKFPKWCKGNQARFQQINDSVRS